MITTVVPAHAAITLGDPAPPTGYSCDPSDPDIAVEITSAFEVLVRNCSGEAAGALIEMSYSTPGGDLGDENH